MRSILLKQFGFPHIRLPFNSMSLLGIDNVAKSLQKASFSATAQPVSVLLFVLIQLCLNDYAQKYFAYIKQVSNKFASVLIPLYEVRAKLLQVVTEWATACLAGRFERSCSEAPKLMLHDPRSFPSAGQ